MTLFRKHVSGVRGGRPRDGDAKGSPSLQTCGGEGQTGKYPDNDSTRQQPQVGWAPGTAGSGEGIRNTTQAGEGPTHKCGRPPPPPEQPEGRYLTSFPPTPPCKEQALLVHNGWPGQIPKATSALSGHLYHIHQPLWGSWKPASCDIPEEIRAWPLAKEWVHMMSLWLTWGPCELH